MPNLGIPNFVSNEPYQALTVLKQSQLNTAWSTETTFTNTVLIPDIVQLALDVMGPSYVFTNNGMPSPPYVITPLIGQIPFLASNSTITGSWVFSNPVAFHGVATFTALANSSVQPRVKAYLASVSQTLTTAVSAAIIFNAEVYNVGGMHSIFITPTRVTIPTGGAGIYAFACAAEFQASATGFRQIVIKKNGVALQQTQDNNPIAGQDSYVVMSFQDSASDGDYYEMFCQQTSGGNLNVVFGNNTYLSALKVW